MFPMVFIGHGSPMMMIEKNRWSEVWKRLGEELPRPRGILMISAHWYEGETLIQEDPEPPMIYDMYGFPQELYEMVYGAKTAEWLITRVEELLFGRIRRVWRGYDHGCYAPLFHMYPREDVPVVQMSINASLSPEEMAALGRRLKPLREEEVLLVGSGNVVHNLGILHPDENTVYKPCLQFDRAVTEGVTTFDFPRVYDYTSLPGAGESAWYPDHLCPLFYLLGAVEPGEKIRVFNEEYTHGSLSMTGYLFGKEFPWITK